MAKADITLRGRNYSIACAPGQEARIVALASQLDARLQHIAGAVGDIGEERLLLIAVEECLSPRAAKLLKPYLSHCVRALGERQREAS